MGGHVGRHLNCFGPNINIFRDPRWGRGHETFGEDPYLTGTLSAAFMRGLQSNDSTYVKARAAPRRRRCAPYALARLQALQLFTARPRAGCVSVSNARVGLRAGECMQVEGMYERWWALQQQVSVCMLGHVRALGSP